jgi:hypothetical protein
MNTSTVAVARTFEEGCMAQDVRIASAQVAALPEGQRTWTIGPSEMDSMEFVAVSYADAIQLAELTFGTIHRLNVYDVDPPMILARLGEPVNL